MFLGEHEHTLDDKGRITLPAKFRDSFPEGLVLTRGMDGCVYAYAKADWTAHVASRLASLDSLSRDDRMIQRHFFSGAAEVTLDRQGRIMMPGALAAHAKSERDVVVAGVAATTTWKSGTGPRGGRNWRMSKGGRRMLPSALRPA